MENVLKGLRPRSVSPTPSSKHDLERAIEDAGDARDIAKDLLRRLPDYDGTEEEVTANVNAPQQNHFHVTVNNGSKPDIELDGEIAVGPVKVRGLPKWLVAVAVPVAAGVTALVAWLLKR